MSVHDRPNARELIAAVRAYIRDEVLSATTDRRARFRALIAANVLAVAERELVLGAADEREEAGRLAALGFAGPPDDARRSWCAALRAGAYDGEPERAQALAAAKAEVTAKLRVSNPAFLEAYTPYPLP